MKILAVSSSHSVNITRVAVFCSDGILGKESHFFLVGGVCGWVSWNPGGLWGKHRFSSPPLFGFLFPWSVYIEIFMCLIFSQAYQDTYVHRRHKNMLITWWYQHIVWFCWRKEKMCVVWRDERGESERVRHISSTWPFSRLFCRIRAT